ncbi:MAG: phosphodiester glycosidase family protein, partial [Candidatus Bipolaricaulota bacterium]|nr:phosphodiester glycosidase family protein [Candidatus Bipolaricaulota bacterium]
TYYEFETDLGAGPVRINYLHINQWKKHYQLLPAVPSTGVGTLGYLDEIAAEHGAVAAINANFFDTATNLPVGLLIVNGTPLSSNYKRRAALGIDLLGGLTFFNPVVSIYLRTEERRKIGIDDVNRPINSNELIGYTPGYSGQITRGNLRSLRVLKVEDERVTASNAELYVKADPSVSLIVADGTARDRLAGIEVGDEANLEFTLDQGGLLITDVISAGPLLFHGGVDVLDPEKEGFRPDSALVNGLTSRSVIATDRYGGLILLAVARDQQSVGADFDDLLSILRSLPVPIRDAIALDGGHSSSLVFKEGLDYRETSSGGRVAAALLLLPDNR